MRFPLLCLLVVCLLGSARAAEPFFKKGDVIALVGGEDMVVASEYGFLELLLTRALPDYKLRFRNLAWEGDTVFEQRRDLNFPTWEEQLDKIGATVVIAQFGQMESLAGKEKLPEFIAAYEKLIERFSGGGKRRVVLIAPRLHYRRSPDDPQKTDQPENMRLPDTKRPQYESAVAYGGSIKLLADRLGFAFVGIEAERPIVMFMGSWHVSFRDAIHADRLRHRAIAIWTGTALVGPVTNPDLYIENYGRLAELVRAKNRLWFDYWRPQNWAFLAGDRTAQPSSRDHLDPTKRWFPPEREAFLPLIEAKEKEIDALAQKLAQP